MQLIRIDSDHGAVLIVQLSDLPHVLASLYDIVIELIPETDGSKFGTRKM
jgi:hypothetical protein